jgi:hypothetical protein
LKTFESECIQKRQNIDFIFQYERYDNTFDIFNLV